MTGLRSNAAPASAVAPKARSVASAQFLPRSLPPAGTLRTAASALLITLALASPVAAQEAAPTAPAADGGTPAATTPAQPATTAPSTTPAPPPAADLPETPASATPAPSGAAPAASPAVPATTPATPAPAATAPAPAIAAPEAAPAGEPTNAPAATNAPAPSDQAAGQTTLTAFGSEDAPAGEGALAEHDLSAWGMFMAADIVVKSVMVGLALASVVTWTIWLAKLLELVGARRRAQKGVRRLGEANGLPAGEGVEAAGWRAGPVAAMVRIAVAERERSAGLPADGVKERVATALQRVEARAGRRMARGTGLLATIGSVAPFVGLFGTVWGIMNSFIGISKANTTNLAVVAPGIAEALLATAIGLVAAIPAVIIYNAFVRAIGGYKGVLADASAGVLQHLSRDLDRAKLAAAPARLSSRIAAE